MRTGSALFCVDESTIRMSPVRSWWHLLAGGSVYLWLSFGMAVRAPVIGVKHEFRLWYGLPYTQFTDGKRG